MKYPSITIVTSTLNPNPDIFKRALISIRNQRYTGFVEHVILDGGSGKSTVDLAKSFDCKVLVIRSSKDEGGGRLYKGLQFAKGEIILILQSDNILPKDNWMSRMVEPFFENEVFSTYPCYNDYTSDSSLLTKYTALFGSPDPTLFYLHKSDKIPQYVRRYDKGRIVDETRNYYIVKFDSNNLPTMGDNGFMIRAGILKKIVKKNKPYIHVDAFLELLENGFDTYGVVKNSVVHVTSSSLFAHIKRRVRVKREFTDKRRDTRKYLVFNPYSSVDVFNLLKFIFYSLTFIQPLFLSIKGYFVKPNKAWFLHPVICFLMVVVYGFGEINWRLMRSIRR